MTALSGHESLASKKPLFVRDEENLIMLEEFLAKLDARFVYLRAGLETLRDIAVPCEASGEEADLGDEYPSLGGGD